MHRVKGNPSPLNSCFLWRAWEEVPLKTVLDQSKVNLAGQYGQSKGDPEMLPS